MVELALNVKKQDIRVLDEKYNKKKAQEIAEQNKKKVFGVISGIVNAFSSERAEVTLTNYEKRYIPFWHVRGESFFEYKRRNNYGFDVKPEVREVKVGSKVFKIDGDVPYCSVDGEDHCIEKYEKEVILDATEKEKDSETKFKPYIEGKSKNIKEIETLVTKNSAVMPISIRASFIVRDIIKDLIRPIQADKVLNEKVDIKKLVLYFRPVHAFEFTESKKGTKKTVEVDGITGEFAKGELIKKDYKEKIFREDTLFEVGAELASTVVPGAGVGVMVGKYFRDKHKRKKEIKEMKKSQAAGKRKKKR